jgi:mRNA interferase RelE/StbE
LPYKAALTKNFLREFKKLPDNIKDGILRAIDEIVANPFSGVRLLGKLEGRWRWRVGKYRIIYKVDQTLKLVVFLDVGPRKTIYE